jgi:acetaldehyde dehydrogenase (acetylating)
MCGRVRGPSAYAPPRAYIGKDEKLCVFMVTCAFTCGAGRRTCAGAYAVRQRMRLHARMVVRVRASACAGAGACARARVCACARAHACAYGVVCATARTQVRIHTPAHA